MADDNINNQSMFKGLSDWINPLMFTLTQLKNTLNKINPFLSASGTAGFVGAGIGVVDNLIGNQNKIQADIAAYGDTSKDPLLRLYGNITNPTAATGLYATDMTNKVSDFSGNLNNGSVYDLNQNIERFGRVGKQNAAGVMGDIGLAALKGAQHGSNFGLWGTIIGGAAGLVTGATNKIFERNNYKAVDAANQRTNAANSANFNALLTHNYTTGERSARLTNSVGAIRLANGGFLNNNNNMYRRFDNGGDISSLNNGVTYFGEGGTHELNKQGGVPQGVAPDGEKNLVEEGEVKFNDYIYSKRLKCPKEYLEQFNLPTSLKNKSFADIAIFLQKESQLRPNDPISKMYLDVTMNKLLMALELFKQDRDNKEKADLMRNLPDDLLAGMYDLQNNNQDQLMLDLILQQSQQGGQSDLPSNQDLDMLNQILQQSGQQSNNSDQLMLDLILAQQQGQSGGMNEDLAMLDLILMQGQQLRYGGNLFRRGGHLFAGIDTNQSSLIVTRGYPGLVITETAKLNDQGQYVYNDKTYSGVDASSWATSNGSGLDSSKWAKRDDGYEYADDYNRRKLVTPGQAGTEYLDMNKYGYLVDALKANKLLPPNFDELSASELALAINQAVQKAKTDNWETIRESMRGVKGFHYGSKDQKGDMITTPDAFKKYVSNLREASGDNAHEIFTKLTPEQRQLYSAIGRFTEEGIPIRYNGKQLKDLTIDDFGLIEGVNGATKTTEGLAPEQWKQYLIQAGIQEGTSLFDRAMSNIYGMDLATNLVTTSRRDAVDPVYTYEKRTDNPAPTRLMLWKEEPFPKMSPNMSLLGALPLMKDRLMNYVGSTNRVGARTEGFIRPRYQDKFYTESNINNQTNSLIASMLNNSTNSATDMLSTLLLNAQRSQMLADNERSVEKQNIQNEQFAQQVNNQIVDNNAKNFNEANKVNASLDEGDKQRRFDVAKENLLTLVSKDSAISLALTNYLDKDYMTRNNYNLAMYQMKTTNPYVGRYEPYDPNATTETPANSTTPRTTPAWLTRIGQGIGNAAKGVGLFVGNIFNPQVNPQVNSQQNAILNPELYKSLPNQFQEDIIEPEPHDRIQLNILPIPNNKIQTNSYGGRLFDIGGNTKQYNNNNNIIMKNFNQTMPFYALELDNLNDISWLYEAGVPMVYDLSKLTEENPIYYMRGDDVSRVSKVDDGYKLDTRSIPGFSTMDNYPSLERQEEKMTNDRDIRLANALYNQQYKDRYSAPVYLGPNPRSSYLLEQDRERAELLAREASLNAARLEFMNIGRPGSAEVDKTALTAQIIYDDLKQRSFGDIILDEFRNAQYVVPGISNVMMAKDIRQHADNGQLTPADYVFGALALSSPLGIKGKPMIDYGPSVGDYMRSAGQKIGSGVSKAVNKAWLIGNTVRDYARQFGYDMDAYLNPLYSLAATPDGRVMRVPVNSATTSSQHRINSTTNLGNGVDQIMTDVSKQRQQSEIFLKDLNDLYLKPLNSKLKDLQDKLKKAKNKDKQGIQDEIDIVNGLIQDIKKQFKDEIENAKKTLKNTQPFLDIIDDIITSINEGSINAEKLNGQFDLLTLLGPEKFNEIYKRIENQVRLSENQALAEFLKDYYSSQGLDFSGLGSQFQHMQKISILSEIYDQLPQHLKNLIDDILDRSTDINNAIGDIEEILSTNIPESVINKIKNDETFNSSIKNKRLNDVFQGILDANYMARELTKLFNKDSNGLRDLTNRARLNKRNAELDALLESLEGTLSPRQYNDLLQQIGRVLSPTEYMQVIQQYVKDENILNSFLDILKDNKESNVSGVSRLDGSLSRSDYRQAKTALNASDIETNLSESYTRLTDILKTEDGQTLSIDDLARKGNVEKLEQYLDEARKFNELLEKRNKYIADNGDYSRAHYGSIDVREINESIELAKIHNNAKLQQEQLSKNIRLMNEQPINNRFVDFLTDVILGGKFTNKYGQKRGINIQREATNKLTSVVESVRQEAAKSNEYGQKVFDYYSGRTRPWYSKPLPKVGGYAGATLLSKILNDILYTDEDNYKTPNPAASWLWSLTPGARWFRNPGSYIDMDARNAFELKIDNDLTKVKSEYTLDLTYFE